MTDKKTQTIENIVIDGDNFFIRVEDDGKDKRMEIDYIIQCGIFLMDSEELEKLDELYSKNENFEKYLQLRESVSQTVGKYIDNVAFEVAKKYPEYKLANYKGSYMPYRNVLKKI